MALHIQASPSSQRASASLDVVQRSEEKGFYSVVGRSVIRIDLRSPTHEKNKIAEKTDRLRTQIRDFVKGLDPAASKIQTDLLPDPNAPQRNTSLIISYRDKEGKLKVLSKSQANIPQTIIEESEKLLNLVQPRRNAHIALPLQLPVPKNEILPMTLNDFAKNDPETIERLAPTDRFIDDFKNRLANYISENPAEPLLKQIQSDLENIDRNAVFTALEACPELPEEERKEALQRGANLAIQKAQEDLTEKFQEWKKRHWIRDRLGALPLMSKLPTLEPSDIRSYGFDVGDLLIEEITEYQKQCAERGSKDKKTPIEHFIVQTMLHKDKPLNQNHPIFQGLSQKAKEGLLSTENPPQQP